MNNNQIKTELEKKIKKLTTLETELEFSRLTDEVLKISKPGDWLYRLLAIATVKRHFLRFERSKYNLKIHAAKLPENLKRTYTVSNKFTFDGVTYSLDDPWKINHLFETNGGYIIYVVNDNGAFISEVSVQEMNKIKYIEVDALCTSGLYNALGIYNGTVHLFKNHLEQSKNTTRRYVYAKWAEGISKELLKKYYRIKNRDEYNKSKAVLHDFKLLTMYHEMGHHYSLHYFYKHLHGLWKLWDNDCYRYIEEMAADYFGEFSTIGMIQKLSEKRRKRKRAKQLLALVAVAVLQNERKKMWHTIDKYEYVHKVTTPLLCISMKR